MVGSALIYVGQTINYMCFGHDIFYVRTFLLDYKFWSMWSIWSNDECELAGAEKTTRNRACNGCTYFYAYSNMAVCNMVTKAR